VGSKAWVDGVEITGTMYAIASVTNRVPDGDMTSAANWTNAACTSSAADATLTLTGDGTSSQAYSYGDCGLRTSGHIYFNKAKLRVTNSDATQIGISTSEGDSYQLTPTINQWYDIYFNLTAPSTYQYLLMRMFYADAATQNGKVMECQYAMQIDLTTAFGAGNEPTASEMYTMIADHKNSPTNKFWNGSVLFYAF
jgi:hypothetical protein